MVKLCGKEINSDLRVDFHQRLKEKYLENFFSEEVFIDEWLDVKDSNYLEQEKLATRFRHTLMKPEDDFDEI